MKQTRAPNQTQKTSKCYQAIEAIRRYAQAESNTYTCLIRRHAVTHHRLCEHECNGATREKRSYETWEQYDRVRESQMQWVEQRKERIEALITKYAKALGLFVKFEGDPRGCTVKLYHKRDLEIMKPVWEKHLEDSRYGHGVNVW